MSIEFDEMAIHSQAGESTSVRRRLVAGTAAVMLVAAAAGAGYGVGRSVGDGSEPVGADATPTTVLTDDSVDDIPPSTDPADDRADVPFDVPEPMTASTDAETDAGVIMASGGLGDAFFGSGPMERVVERVTESGLTVRAHRGEAWDRGLDDWGVAGWQPAPWCFEAGQLRVSMSGPDVIDVGSVGWYTEPYRGRAVSAVLLGGPDGRPHWVVVVQTPPDTTEVIGEFPNGVVDRAVPQNGYALLVAPSEAPTQVTEGGTSYWLDPEPDYQVTIVGAAEPVVVDSDGLGTWLDDDFRDACQPPPPPLPAPGEQPADAAAADAEVATAMSALYGAEDPGAAAAEHLDDATGVAEARQQIADGGFAETAASAAAVIEELVFTSPTEAWFRYRIETDTSVFDNRYGIAVVVDGNWKITRSTLCQDMAMAGGRCAPDWEYIQPPSAGGPQPAGSDGFVAVPPTTEPG